MSSDGPPPTGTIFEIMQQVASGDVSLPAQSGVSPMCASEDFIRKCLHKEEEMRWSAEELLQHPFLNCVPQDFWLKVMRQWLVQHSHRRPDRSAQFSTCKQAAAE